MRLSFNPAIEVLRCAARARFVRDGRRINFPINYRDKPMRVPLESASREVLALRVYDPRDGSMTNHDTPATATIGPFSSLLVVEGADAYWTEKSASP